MRKHDLHHPQPYRERPRPVRRREYVTPQQFDQLFDPVCREAIAHGRTAGDVLMAMLNTPGLDRIVQQVIDIDGGPHGMMFLLTETLHALDSRHTIMQVDPALTRLLDATDFSDEHPIPASYCRLPLEAPLFIHVPNAPDTLDVLSDSDRLPLSGYYLREVPLVASRVLEVVAVSQPPPHDASGETDNFVFVDIPIDNEDESLLTLFQRADIQARAQHGAPDNVQARERAKVHLTFLLKFLVYCNLRDARQTAHKPYTHAMQHAERLGPSKQPGALRRANRLYDYITISADPPGPTQDGDATGSTGRAAHQRRGHFRNAWVGEGRQERRLVWVRPAVVGLPGATPKHYVVK